VSNRRKNSSFNKGCWDKWIATAQKKKKKKKNERKEKRNKIKDIGP
jgi:hypothetical protein